MYNEKQIAMKHVLFLFAALLYCSVGNAQQLQEECDCNVEIFLDPDSCDVLLPVYNNAERDSVIAYFKNKCEEECFVCIQVMYKKVDMLRVMVYYSVPPEKTVEGWISIKNPLGIYSRAYKKPLTIYSQPTEASSAQNIFDEYINKTYAVLDCHGYWLKIRRILHGKVYIGWIPPEMQCSSVYTTCS